MRMIILSTALIFISLSGYTQNTLKVNVSFPSQIKNNQDFKVNLTITKPADLQSYSVFTQNLPKGFFAKPEKMNGASFDFKDNILTITWLRLPAKSSVKTSYTISYIKDMTGTFSLSGNFNYLIENKKGEYKLRKSWFSILPTGTNTYNNISNYSNNSASYKNIKCLRKVLIQPDKSLLIELNLTNLPKVKNSVLTEEVSSEFEIQTNESENSSVSQNKRLIQFNIPDKNSNKTIKLTYRLIPKYPNEKNEPVIFGKLSFIENNQIINIPIENQQK